MTEDTVWVTGGCTSYYIDRNGHNSALWPTYTWPFRQQLREFERPPTSWHAAPEADPRPPGGALPRHREHVVEARRALVWSVSTVPGQ